MTSRSTRQRLRRIGQRPAHPPSEAGGEALNNVIVIGASAGGLAALTTILSSLPLDLPAPVIVILHQKPSSMYELAPAIERMTHLPVVPVAERAELRPGAIFVPTLGKALTLRRGHISPSVEAVPPGSFTTIDRTFASAAQSHGDRVIGVVLTGVLRDGTAGLRAVHKAGGLTVVQDPEGAEYPDMPRSAMKDLPVTFCLALPEIGFALDLMVRRSSRLESGIAVSVRILKKRIEMLVRLKQQSEKNVQASKFLDEELLILNRDVQAITRLLRTVPPEIRR